MLHRNEKYLSVSIYFQRLTVRKEGPNQGRQFYACPKSHGDADRCQFFIWADEAESGSYSGGGGDGGGGRGGSSRRGGCRGSFSGRASGGRGGRTGPTPAKKPKVLSKPSNFRATG